MRQAIMGRMLLFWNLHTSDDTLLLLTRAGGGGNVFRVGSEKVRRGHLRARARYV